MATDFSGADFRRVNCQC
ncbi:hypothetical protein [Calothrix sp. NIES-2100]